MDITSLDPPYCYYAFAIDPHGDVDHLHYGLWDSRTSGIKDAQESLARLVQSLLPRGVQRILDVGCGLGTTTATLSIAGYDVIGISPDARNMASARAKNPDVAERLLTVGFEQYRPAHAFDLVLFQESAQYVPLLTIMPHSRDVLKEDGYLLICDEVKYDDAPGRAFHHRDRIIDQASANGFGLVHDCTITPQVLPTRHFLVKRLRHQQTALIEIFRECRAEVASEVAALIEGWEEGTRLFEQGCYGYELFLFRKLPQR